MKIKYHLFDKEDRSFETKIESNDNIFKVCEVMMSCSFKSHSERVYYADIGDLPPEKDEEGNIFYEFKNRFASKKEASLFLAQELFYEFPKVAEVRDGKTRILDEKLAGRLIRSEVWRAFEEFLGKFGETPFEVSALLTTLAENPTLTNIIETIGNIRGLHSTKTGTNSPEKNGQEESLNMTAGGGK